DVNVNFRLLRKELIDRLKGISDILQYKDFLAKEDGILLQKETKEFLKRILQVLITKTKASKVLLKRRPCTITRFYEFGVMQTRNRIINPTVECLRYLDGRIDYEMVLIDFTDEHSLNRLEGLIDSVKPKNSIVRFNFVPKEGPFHCDALNLMELPKRARISLIEYLSNHYQDIEYFSAQNVDGIDKIIALLKNLKYLKVLNSRVENVEILCSSFMGMNNLEYIKLKGLDREAGIDLNCLQSRKLRRLSIDWCASNKLKKFNLNTLTMGCSYTFPDERVLPTKSTTLMSVKNEILPLVNVPNSFKISSSFVHSMKFIDSIVQFENFQFPYIIKYSFENCTFENPELLNGDPKLISFSRQSLASALKVVRRFTNSLIMIKFNQIKISDNEDIYSFSVSNWPSLSKLKIRNSNFSDSHCSLLASSIAKMPSLKVLDLSGNPNVTFNCKNALDSVLLHSNRTLSLIIN
ncbi:hypothetical protein ROZALSC1DRAFT_30395, partial [Rozella allomycis CSF55]